MDRNPTAFGPVIAPYVSPSPPPVGSPAPVGPYALGDAVLLVEILTAARFASIDVDQQDAVVESPAEALYGDEQLAFRRVPADQMDGARTAMEQHLAEFRGSDGLCRVPLAFHIVRARRP